MKGLQLLVFILWFPKGLLAFEEDSTLTYEEYMDIVRQHHPLAVQAGLQQDYGKAAVLSSKAGFEPKAQGDLSQKYYGGNQYYSLLDAGLKVPTWFGIELKGGYEQNQGQYLNPQNKVPDEGLWYAGISIPLGQGLFIDERRAELRKARVFLNSTEAERRAMLNELFYDAGKSYWEWFENFNKLQVFKEAVETATSRKEAIIQSVLLGDKPYIDTLEADIQLRNRLLALWEAEMEYQNSSAKLAVFLWQDGNIPLEPSPSIHPPLRDAIQINGSDPDLLQQSDSLIDNHPHYLLYGFKLQDLEIEERWKREQLKPQLDLNYNALTNASPDFEDLGYNPSNYKWGLSVSMPILLRKERAGLQITKLKINEAELEQSAKKAELRAKVISGFNLWNTTARQSREYERTVRNYRRLVEGENQLFFSGESSLFMVNSREMAFINAQLKFLELLSKNRKAELNSLYTLGILAP